MNNEVINEALKKELSLELTNGDKVFNDYEMTKEAVINAVDLTLDILGISKDETILGDK